MSDHKKVTEELLPAACYGGDCSHEDECELVDVEVCSECREEFEDGDMVLLTPWAVAEANGHVAKGVDHE